MPRDLLLAPRVALVAEGRRHGVPWCIWCNSPVGDPGGHGRCLAVLQRSQWWACRACLGGGIGTGGDSCRVCYGVGFIAADDDTSTRHAGVLGLVDGVTW